MKRVTPISLALTLGFALACGGGGGETTTTTTTTPPPADGKIGVQECDDYITKMEACLGNMDPTLKAATEQSFKTARESWATAAATPEGKAGLASACKAALDAIPPVCSGGAAPTPATGTTDAAKTDGTATDAAKTDGAADAAKTDEKKDDAAKTDEKKDDAAKTDEKKDDAAKTDEKKDEAKKDETKTSTPKEAPRFSAPKDAHNKVERK